MINPVLLFRDGGPFMYLLLLLAPVALIGALLPGLAVVLKRRIPTAATLAPVMLPALVGGFGWFQAVGLVTRAVEFASFEMMAPLAAQGLSISLYTVIVGGMLTGLAGFLAATVDLAASLFTDREPEQTAATRASRRNGGFVLLAVGFGGVGVGWLAMRYAAYWGAQANASAEMRSLLMADAMTGVPLALPLIGGAVALCLIAALVHALAVPASRTVRTAIGAAVGWVVVLPTLALPLGRAGTALDLIELATPWAQRRAEVFAVDPIELPTSEVFAKGLPPRVTVRYTSSGVRRVDGPRGPTSLEAVRADENGPAWLRVEASGDTRLMDLWTAVGPQLEATVRTPSGQLGSLYVARADRQLPKRHAVWVIDGDHSALRSSDRGTVEAIGVGALRDLAIQYANHIPEESVAYLPAHATLDDAIQLHEALGMDNGPRWDGAPRAPRPRQVWLTTEPAPPLPDDETPDGRNAVEAP